LAALRESLDLARRLDDGLVTFYLCWTVMLLLLEHRPPFLLARLVGIVEGLGARANAAGNLNFGSAYSTPQSREALRWAVEAAKRELGETGYVAAVAVGRTGTDHALREVAAALEEGDAEPAVFATETRTVAGDGLVSVREAEVLDLVAQGLSNKVIADRLFIAPTTAKFHVTSLLNKLGADTRAQLVAVAAQRGLLA
jgi:DNA-binding CsgD family transcriptional regulator